MVDYTGTKLETADTAKEHLTSTGAPLLGDSCLKEYIHKAVGIVGVSAGPFGGTRVIQNILPVMREMGLVTIFWDVNFSNVQNCFNAEGIWLNLLIFASWTSF